MKFSSSVSEMFCVYVFISVTRSVSGWTTPPLPTPPLGPNQLSKVFSATVPELPATPSGKPFPLVSVSGNRPPAAV